MGSRQYGRISKLSSVGVRVPTYISHGRFCRYSRNFLSGGGDLAASLGEESVQYARSIPNPSRDARWPRRLAGRQPPAWAIALFGFLVAVLLWPPSSVQAQFQPVGGITEYDLKVAYLYNFTRYFAWPKTAFESDHAPFVIGVLGDDPLGAALDDVARRKTVRGRPIVIRRFTSWKDYKPCQLLFLPKTIAQATRAKVIAQTRRSPLLLIGETRGFAADGATVNFYPDINGTIGFEINVGATAQRKLGVDARLLKLARVVRSSSQPGGGER